jgi:hypothetical protein
VIEGWKERFCTPDAGILPLLLLLSITLSFSVDKSPLSSLYNLKYIKKRREKEKKVYNFTTRAMLGSHLIFFIFSPFLVSISSVKL